MVLGGSASVAWGMVRSFFDTAQPILRPIVVPSDSAGISSSQTDNVPLPEGFAQMGSCQCPGYCMARNSMAKFWSWRSSSDSVEDQRWQWEIQQKWRFQWENHQIFWSARLLGIASQNGGQISYDEIRWAMIELPRNSDPLKGWEQPRNQISQSGLYPWKDKNGTGCHNPTGIDGSRRISELRLLSPGNWQRRTGRRRTQSFRKWCRSRDRRKPLVGSACGNGRGLNRPVELDIFFPEPWCQITGYYWRVFDVKRRSRFFVL